MATVDPPIRTWDGNYGGDWFGSTYQWFGPRLGAAARGYLIEREPCDCCYTTCACLNCTSFGYWDSYDATIPVPYGYIPPWTVFNVGTSAAYAYFYLSGPRTFTLDSVTLVNGGEQGNCCAEYFEQDIEFNHGGTDYYINSIRVTYCPNNTVYGQSTLFLEVIEPDLQFGLPTTAMWNVMWLEASTEEHCLVSVTLNDEVQQQVIGHRQSLNWNIGPTSPPVAPIAATVEPSAGAVWVSCGTDDTGAPIVDPGGPGLRTEKVSGLPFVTVKKSLPVTAVHADRCDHYQGRAEKKAGCNGWRCKGICDLGLPAVPGKYCQTCDKYEADPDYVGQGVSGWLK